MKTTVETLDEVKIKLTVEVEPARVKKAFDAAARELAKQVALPGFRPGKAPRKLLEQRLGKGAIAQQAMENSLTEFYVEALQAEKLDPVAMPEVDVKTFDENEGCTFDATVEIRPEIEVPDHTGIAVTFPEWDVSDDDVDERIEQLRARFAEVDEVDRPAKAGDFVTLDLVVKVDGEEIESAHVEDALYEVGSGGVTPKLDDELLGKEADAEFTYTDTMPDEYPEYGGQEAEFVVTVKDVRARTLPDLDDDFAATASEFDTLEELRKDVRDNLLRQRIMEARRDLRGKILEAYLAGVTIPIPPSMVTEDVAERRHQLAHQAEQYGMDLDDLFETEGTDAEAWERDASEHASASVKARLVLEALAEKLSIEVVPDDVNAEIYRHAMQMGMDPNQVAQAIQQQGTLPALVGDVLRRKALDAIVDASEVDGEPSDDVLREVGILPTAEMMATDISPESATSDSEDSVSEDSVSEDEEE